MEPIVIDSDIIVASFLDFETHHSDARRYVVEVTSAIRRRARNNRAVFLNIWQQNVVDWEQDGKLVLYSLGRDRMNNSRNFAERYGLRGSDSVIASLAEELGFSLRTFDREILERYQQASQ